MCLDLHLATCFREMKTSSTHMEAETPWQWSPTAVHHEVLPGGVGRCAKLPDGLHHMVPEPLEDLAYSVPWWMSLQPAVIAHTFRHVYMSAG